MAISPYTRCGPSKMGQRHTEALHPRPAAHVLVLGITFMCASFCTAGKEWKFNEISVAAGSFHTFVAPNTGSYTFKAFGSSGMQCQGDCYSCDGGGSCPNPKRKANVGKGGYAAGTLDNVNTGDTFAIFVGGPGVGKGTNEALTSGAGGGLVAVFDFHLVPTPDSGCIPAVH